MRDKGEKGMTWTSPAVSRYFSPPMTISQLSFDDIGYLFVDMFVFGGYAAFLDIPKHEGAGVAVDHLSEKARKGLFYRNILQVLHALIFAEGVQKNAVVREPGMWISGKAVLAEAG